LIVIVFVVEKTTPNRFFLDLILHLILLEFKKGFFLKKIEENWGF